MKKHLKILFFLIFLVARVEAQNNNSVFKTGSWVKVAIKEDGIYKLSFTKLKEMGFSEPEKVRIFSGQASMLGFYNNEKRDSTLSEISVLKDNNAVYFFGQSPNTWFYDENKRMYLIENHLFSDENYYFITSNNSLANNNIQQTNYNSFDEILSQGDFYYHHEKDLVNLQMSGRDWFGENFFYNTSQNFVFETFNIPLQGKLEASLVARSAIDNSFTLQVADFKTTTTAKAVSSSGLYAQRVMFKTDFVPENDNKITVNILFNKNSPSAEGYLDYITINTKENLNYNSQQLQFSYFFSDTKKIKFNVITTNSDVMMWNVSNKKQPTYALNADNFIFESQKGKNDFVIFRKNDAFEIENYEKMENQNLRENLTPDLLIITPKIFLPYAQKLQSLHSDLKTMVVETEKIYNEFSSGKTDVSAIRDYIRFLYKQDKRLKYVLLFGDGSVDNKTKNENNTNLIPTYQSPNSLNEDNLDSFVSDDFFGLLDDNEGEYFGDIDIGIGRLPAKTTSEAQTLVNKIEDYLQKNGDNGSWKKNVTLISDDGDNNLHVSQADFLAEYLEENSPEFQIKKIYASAYKQQSTASSNTYPQARENIINAFNNGSIVINYTGHGGMNYFADERLLTNSDIDLLKNKNKLPLFITASCNIGHFDYYDKESNKAPLSPAEHCLLNPNGGAIAMFTTTRNVLSRENFQLNQNIFLYLFDKENRLGDIIRKAKNITNDNNMLNFTLLGDPALKLSLTDYDIKITEINSKDYESFSDTLKALSQCEIKAKISGADNFSGNAFVTIFDKKQQTKTLTNSENPLPFEYQDYTIKIFDGISTVKNSEFSFKFIIPKDIDFNRIDFGKIILYAENKEHSAIGVSKKILIGSSLDNALEDISGPEITLYLNDKNFVSGSKTSSEVSVFAEICDSSGINISAKVPGHGITLILDDDNNSSYLLTDYFKFNNNSYTSGKVEYKLENLKTGNHTLKLKVWDNYNNSSEQTIDFYVVDNDKLSISRLFNYPNPFSTDTKFYFEHNSPQSTIEYELTIFTVSGKIVKSFSGSFFSTETLSEPINWDAKDKYSNSIARGVYFYRLKIKDSQNRKAVKYEKLLYIN